MQSNPDVILAEAKVREAEAALNQVRLKVLRDVTATFRKRSSVAELVASAKRQHEAGQRPATEVIELVEVEGENEANLLYLLGRSSGVELGPFRPRVTALGERGSPWNVLPLTLDAGGGGTTSGGTTDSAGAGAAPDSAGDGNPGDASSRGGGGIGAGPGGLSGAGGGGGGFMGGAFVAQVPQEAPAEIQNALQVNISASFSEMLLPSLLESLQASTNVAFLVDRNSTEIQGLSSNQPINLNLPAKVPLRTVLEALGDAYGIRFVVRDYGILVTGQGANIRSKYEVIPPLN